VFTYQEHGGNRFSHMQGPGCEMPALVQMCIPIKCQTSLGLGWALGFIPKSWQTSVGKLSLYLTGLKVEWNLRMMKALVPRKLFYKQNPTNPLFNARTLTESRQYPWEFSGCTNRRLFQWFPRWWQCVSLTEEKAVHIFQRQWKCMAAWILPLLFDSAFLFMFSYFYFILLNL
jgi:hypothetical protein